MRIESDRPHEKGGWLHPREAEYHDAPIPPRPPRKTDEELSRWWAPIATHAHLFNGDNLPHLSREIGVSIASIACLQVGYAEIGDWCWTFPERNAAGLIVGINRRFMDGSKKNASGSRRGLTYESGWYERSGTIFIVEGGSDTAAGITLGLPVVGRPSNIGGVSMLAELLQDHKHRNIAVAGERDKKTPLHISQMTPPHDPKCRCCNRCYPGRYGAQQVAQALGKRLKKQIGIVMPPRGHKDLRSWFVATGVDPEDREACLELGKQLQQGRWSGVLQGRH